MHKQPKHQAIKELTTALLPSHPSRTGRHGPQPPALLLSLLLLVLIIIGGVVGTPAAASLLRWSLGMTAPGGLLERGIAS